MPLVYSPWQKTAVLFMVIAFTNGLVWSWLGAPVAMPPSPFGAGSKADCMSYTPYQADDSPFNAEGRIIAPELIDADVARLAPMTKCLRTYSAAGHGIGEVAPAAGRSGLTLMQGIWISRETGPNIREIEAALAIAKSNPGTVSALIVGNEVLLRQEQTAPALVEIIKSVKQRSSVPVTYADVWEFWIKNPEVADAVDFITIHILPFWEDEPESAGNASQHVAKVYDHMIAAFPGKRIIIGEVGWPSAGRMREVALPSRSNQARVLHEVMAMTHKRGITANIIEAFDQPWKRHLEGTVGGHWGLFDAHDRAPKFTFGEAVSDHPYWRWQAGLGTALAAVVLAISARAARRRPDASGPQTLGTWLRIGVVTGVGCALAGLSAETLMAGAFGAGGIARSLVLGAIAFAAPFLAVAISAGVALPTFAQTVGPSSMRARCPLTLAAGYVWIATFLTAVEVALTLVFYSRYWEFPFAPLTAAAVGFAALGSVPQSLKSHLPADTRMAEIWGAILLAACALFIVPNEGVRNWQALWLSGALLVLAVTLWSSKGAPVKAQ